MSFFSPTTWKEIANTNGNGIYSDRQLDHIGNVVKDNFKKPKKDLSHKGNTAHAVQKHRKRVICIEIPTKYKLKKNRY